MEHKVSWEEERDTVDRQLESSGEIEKKVELSGV